MPHSTLRVVVSALALTVAACEEDDPTLTQAQDARVPDAGDADPLPLAPGMRFTYFAQLVHRETQNSEFESTYRVTLEITSVDDRASEAPSSLTFTMTDDSTVNAPDWSPAFDFDSWVGRLGPSRDADTVASDPIVLRLDGAPSLPSPAAGGAPKSLPPASTYFIDARRESEIVNDWTATQPGGTADPNPVDPTIATSLSSDGLDESIAFFDVKRRSVTLDYTSAGFLDRLSETIGDPTDFPRTTASLTLEEGP